MGDSLPSWYESIVQRLGDRNRVESENFSYIIQLNELLHEKAYAHQVRNKQLESKLHELDGQCAELVKYKESGDPEQVKTLRSLVESLKDEISGLYKLNGTNAQNLLQAKDELQKLQLTTEVLRLEKQKLSDAVNLSDRKLHDLQELVKEKNNVILIIKDELTAHQLELVKREEELSALKADNQMLVERWMRKMQEEADRMNLVNNFELVRFRSNSSASVKSAQLSSSSQSTPATLHCDYSNLNYLLRTITVNDTELTCMCCSKDGSTLAVGGSDKYLRLYDVKSGLPDKTIVGPLTGSLCVSFSSNGDFIAGAGYENAITVASTSTCRTVHTLTGHSGKVFAAKFGLSDKVYSGSHDRTIKLWDLTKGYCSRTMFAMSSCNDVSSLDSTGNSLVSGHLDKALRFWDTRSGNCVRELSNLHGEQITSVAASPSGNRVLTCSRDNTLKILDARTFQVEATLSSDLLKIPRNWARAAWSPDGMLIAVGSLGGQLLRWSASDYSLLEPPMSPSSAKPSLVSCEFSDFEKGRLITINTANDAYIYGNAVHP